MSKVAAITVENLSKRYIIGHQSARGDGLRHAVENFVRSPFRWLADRRKAKASTREEFWALKDVSFEVKQGDVVGFIGRNGAGKSTLLKVLSRITEPTTGQIRVRGRVASLLEVGTGFHPELTGRENIFLNGAILGMSRTEIKRKFDEIVAFSEIEKFLDTPVKRYSSGMYVRLAFAVAAHLEPEILIVDEVLAVGDAQFQKKCMNKMQDVGSGGRTVLFVSHSMPAVTRLCNKAVLLASGRVLAAGPTTEVVRAYIKSGSGSVAERTWNHAKNNAPVFLKAVRAVKDNREVCDVFKTSESFAIEVEYVQRRPRDRFTVSLQFHNDEGTVVFTTNDWNDSEWWNTPRRAGEVKVRCQVPGYFLAEGQLSLLIGICTYNPDEVFCLEKDAITFQIVEDNRGKSRRSEFGGNWPGVVRPELEWSAGYQTSSGNVPKLEREEALIDAT